VGRLLALACGLAACEVNQSGDLQAERFGDMSHPAERGDAHAELVRACGPTPAASAEVASPLRRRPYLQQMTDRSVRVLWTAAPDATAPPSIVVTRADGGVVADVPATHDRSAIPGGGSLQWLAAVTGLEPDTIYCYEVRGGGANWTRAGFRTAPPPGAERPVRVVAFGDSGSGSDDQRQLLAQLGTVPFDFVIHTGDLAYDSGSRAEIERNVFRVYADLFERFAFFPASGNHEYDTEQAAPFREAFDLPANGGPLGRERWYAFDWGNVHFVALDTERVGPDQAAWLDADLTANRRPWTIVYGHKPPFSSGSHGSDAAVRQHFVPLFDRHKVPLVLSGLDHHYERTTAQNGVTYVVTGGGGKGTRGVGSSAFTAFAEQVVHFLYVTVAGDRLTLHAIDGRGQEFDSAVIRR